MSESIIENNTAPDSRQLDSVQGGLKTTKAGALRRRSARVRSRALLDLGALVAASAAVALLMSGFHRSFLGWQIVFVLLVLLQFSSRGGYMRRLRPELLEEIRLVIPATAIAGMFTLTLEYALTGAVWLPGVISQWAFATTYLIAARIGVRLGDSRVRKWNAASPTLIIGAGQVGRLLAHRLLTQPSTMLKPIGFLDKEPMLEDPLGIPVMGASWDLERVIAEHEVDHVIITFSTAPTHVVLDIVKRCEALGVTVSSVPRLYESVNGRMSLDHFGGVPLLTKEPVDPECWQFRCKYAADRLLAAVLLFLFLPIFALLAISIRLKDGYPIFFRQVRIGKDGKAFEMLKFRSMRGDAPNFEDVRTLRTGVGPGGVEGHDRRTLLGGLIRRASLDELPQLLNVMRGDMSLVGPRPERPEFVEQFEQEIYRYGERHRVKVGMTGWAQINGLRGKTSLEDRAEWDNYYIENWSPWLDFKIMLLTFAALFHGYHVSE